MSHRDFYPRWIELPTGQKMIVADHQQHSAILGQDFDERAQPVVRLPKPPSIEEILAAGYSPDAAESIFAREQSKEAQGIEPYGSKPTSEFVPEEDAPTAPVVIPFPSEPAELPAEEEFTGPFYPPAAEQATPEADDPLGIFESGTAEEVPVGASATADKPAKRRGKSKE